MFIGHFAVGLAAKRVAPKVGLEWLILAPLFLDVLWPLFLALGWETVRIDPGNTVVTPLDLHDYPYSHSLMTSLGWSLLLGALYWFARRAPRDAMVLGALVFSHFILDWATHRPDMPLYPGSETRIGLGLWNSLIGTLVVEVPMFVVGVLLYSTVTRAKNRVGTWSFWSLVVLLAIFYVAAVFGPPPPSERAIMVMGIVAWLFMPWAGWIDRNRQVTAHS